MINGILDLMCGAELYRRYNMLNFNNENNDNGDEYIFDCEDRLNKLKQYYTNSDIELHNIEEISDYLTYGYEIHNEVLDDNTLKIKCSSVSDDYIEYLDELANDVCNKILIATDCDIEYLINYENRNIIINIYNII